MNELKSFENKQRFKKLPVHVQLISKYHQWLMYDLRVTGNTDSFEQTYVMRKWLTETLKALGVEQDILPIINEKNYLRTWYECNEKLDIFSLKAMEDEFYDIKKRYNGYTAVKI